MVDKSILNPTFMAQRENWAQIHSFIYFLRRFSSRSDAASLQFVVEKQFLRRNFFPSALQISPEA